MFLANKLNKGGNLLSPDGQFNYVTMLLHGDGTNGAQNNTFIDSSTNAFTITRNGNTTQGSFSPYGSNWSNYFNASSSYLTAPAASIADFGTGDFIVEAWFNCASTTGNQKIFDNYNGNNNPNPTLLLNIGGAGKVSWYAGQTAVINSSSTFLVGVWNYVVVSRVSSTTKMFLNGTEVGSVSDTRTYAAGYTNIGIGAEANGGGSAFNGYISNLRVVKGSGVTSSTIPTTPSTAITNTVLLTCQSNRFIDNSSNAYTITANGTPSVQRFNPFGTSTAYSTSVIGGSGYFDASGDYLSTPSSSAFAFGTGDFTIEAWVYSLDVSSGTQRGFIQTSATAGGLSTSFTAGVFFVFGTPNGDGTINANVGNTNYASSGGAVKANAWTHIAVTRASGAVKVFVDGAIVASGTGNTSNLTGTYACIGGYYSTAYLYQGYLSDLRIVKGTAVYTSAFTPPTAPLTAISGTSLLTNFTNGAIFDNAMMNDLETVGNAQISTSVKKYGTGSLAFDGTGDRLVGPPTYLYDLAGDFTIECWANFNTLAGTYTGIASYADSSGWYGWQLIKNNSNIQFQFLSASAGVGTVTSSSTVTTGVWYHIAVVRSGSTITLYIDGTSKGTSTTTASYSSANSFFRVGDERTISYPLDGYVDDLRITKGYARYTATFTAPTAAFSDTGPY
jgi:hypothetical protein